MAEGIPLIVEHMCGAAIDAARISTSTAQILVAQNERLPLEVRDAICSTLEEGLQWLHSARQLMPEEDASSLHVVRAAPSGLIITP